MFCVGRKERSEILFGGEVLQQLAECEREAEMGQTIMSKPFRKHLPKRSIVYVHSYILLNNESRVQQRSLSLTYTRTHMYRYKETKMTKNGNYMLMWERIVEQDGDDSDESSSEEDKIETEQKDFLAKCFPFLQSSSDDSKVAPETRFLEVGRRTNISYKALQRT